jgi:curved DNA-binding protein CbpA
VRAAYRALAARHHPDVGGDESTMKRLNAAYAALQAAGNAAA